MKWLYCGLNSLADFSILIGTDRLELILLIASNNVSTVDRFILLNVQTAR